MEETVLQKQFSEGDSQTDGSADDAGLTVSDHDIIYFFGDFNYRIDVELSREDIFRLIDAGDLNALRAKDQLNIERQRGSVFVGFEEGVLTFPPTYKFEAGTDQ